MRRINSNRANANAVMGRVLYNLPKVNIVSLTGGSKDNAIPRECVAIIAVPDVLAAKQAVEKIEKRDSGRMHRVR